MYTHTHKHVQIPGSPIEGAGIHTCLCIHTYMCYMHTYTRSVGGRGIYTCLCVRMGVYIYIHMYVCVYIHIYIYIYMYICMYVCMYKTYICTYTGHELRSVWGPGIYTRFCIHTYMCYIHTPTHPHVHTYVRTYIHTYTRTYI